jgi:hypothetical protein
MSKKEMLKTKLQKLALKGIDGQDTELFDYTARMEDIYMWGLKNMPAKVMQYYINLWEKEDEEDGRSL